MKSPTFPEISYADWRRQVESQLGDLQFDEVLVNRAGGIDFEALCTAHHPQRSPGNAQPAGRAGTATFSPDEVCWIPCQQFGEPDLVKLNHHLKSDLDNGVRGIWLRLDQAARQGENPSSSDAVGKDGAALYRLADLAAAFEGVPAGWQSLLLDAGGNFLPATAMLVSWMRDSGLESESRTLLLGADPLGTLARDGELPASLDQLSDNMAELVRQSQEKWSASRALAINTQPYREAGAEIDQELAICLSTGTEYLRRLEKRGISPEAMAAELTFITSTGQRIFLEIAKLRALRALWGRVLGACDVGSMIQPWIHAAVLRRNLPSREPSFNVLRGTTASWAAVVGGADSIETPAYDWFDKSTESDRGRRLARNTQHILGLEGQIGRVADPGAGSYFLETVTQQLIGKGWAHFQEIEKQGGLLAGLSSGWIQNAIARRWEKRRSQLEQGHISLTGVNVYSDPNRRFQDPTDDQISRVLERIRRRFTKQQEDLDLPRISNPEESRDLWQWCLESAAENRSVGEMGAAIHSGEVGPVIEPLRPHRDSEPSEDESVES